MSKVSVLPVYPRFPLTFWSFERAVECMGKKAVMPPTGLATVAAMLPRDRFDVRNIVDLNTRKLEDADFEGVDLVMTSSMIVQQDSLDDVIDRAHHHGAKVVSGGPFPTTYPEKTAADYIVTGEAEVTLGPFVENFLGGTSQRVWAESSVPPSDVVELTREGKAHITRTPLPRWDLVDLGEYSSAAIQYSRGCPFNCDFCDITKLYGHVSRTKTPEQMIAEFDALYRAGHRGPVFVVDDNFIGNRDHVRELLPALEQWQAERGFPYSLFTEASMDLAWDQNDDIRAGMQQAGFDFVFLGIESVDDEVLKKMHKGQNTKLPQLEAVRRIQNSGMEVSGGFIIGSDGEKENVFDGLFAFIQAAGIPIPMPGLLTAVRGTDLYTRLEDEGRIREESHGNNTHQLGFNFEPQLDEEFLIDGYKRLIEGLFDPVNYFARCRTLRDNVGESRTPKRRGMGGLVTFARSLGRQMFRKGGLEYVRYLADTALRRPGYFAEAVAHGVKFDHFKHITQVTLEADAYGPHTESLYQRFVRAAENSYRAHHHDLEVAKQKVSAAAQEILAGAEQRFSQLHVDFRGRAEKALSHLRARVERDLQHYLTGVCPLT